jgi:hypothetical protein
MEMMREEDELPWDGTMDEQRREQRSTIKEKKLKIFGIFTLQSKYELTRIHLIGDKNIQFG